MTDEERKGFGELHSANRWLSNEDGTSVLNCPFLTGDVVLPRTVNSAYLVSDTLARMRDPHLYSTLPGKDITRIDFALTDSRGLPLDLQDSNFSFVVTFSTDHLMM